jgi:neutral peptidase B
MSVSPMSTKNLKTPPLVLTPFYTLPDVDVFRFKGLGSAPELVVSSTKGILNKLDTVAIQTYESALDVVKYYKSEFNRDSFDNKHAHVNIIIGYEEAPGSPLNNAFWNNDDKTLYFGDGDGKLLTPLGTARDVVAHEFGHAVISSEVKLDYTGESGGIHESVSDIFATGVDYNLQIGEDVFTPDIKGDAIRDLEHLSFPTVDDVKKSSYFGEPHAMSEPLSNAAVLASKSVGLDKIRNIWYTAITDNLKNHSGYSGFRDATEAAALKLYGAETRQSVADAFKAVGILGTKGA